MPALCLLCAALFAAGCLHVRQREAAAPPGVSTENSRAGYTQQLMERETAAGKIDINSASAETLMLLPGIAGYETIQRHHKQALNPGFGNGTNADVRSANMADTNIFHADIFEAAAMARPCFGLNVVVNDDYRIIKAFAGDWVQSHAAACRLVDSMEGVTIPERTPLVVASAGGYPKDINLYQTIKLLSNALSAVQPGGTMILLSRCSEGFGNPDVETQICAYSDMQAREKALRDTFSIGSYVGFLFAEAAEKHNLILVTDMDAALFGKTKMHVCHSLDEAVDKARHFLGNELVVLTMIMPHGASNLPMLAV